MTFEKAVAQLRTEYEKACKNELIKSPLAYALYKTWRFVDGKEKKARKSYERKTD